MKEPSKYDFKDSLGRLRVIHEASKEEFHFNMNQLTALGPLSDTKAIYDKAQASIKTRLTAFEEFKAEMDRTDRSPERDTIMRLTMTIIQSLHEFVALIEELTQMLPDALAAS